MRDKGSQVPPGGEYRFSTGYKRAASPCQQMGRGPEKPTKCHYSQLTSSCSRSPAIWVNLDGITPLPGHYCTDSITRATWNIGHICVVVAFCTIAGIDPASIFFFFFCQWCDYPG